MKKILEKVTSIALAIISLLLVALVWSIMFKPEIAQGFNAANKELLIAFIVILSSAFLILSGINIYSSFTDNEKLSDVLLFKDRESATKATVGVVKKTAKRITKNMDAAKIRKVTLYTDSSGNISMNVEIKVKSDKTMDVITNVRALLIESFDSIFGIEFSAINFRISNSKNKFVPKDEDVKAQVEKLKASIVANKPLPGKVQSSKITGHLPIEQLEAESQDLKDDQTEQPETESQDLKDDQSKKETPIDENQELLEQVIADENLSEDSAIEEKAREVENAQEIEKAPAEDEKEEETEIMPELAENNLEDNDLKSNDLEDKDLKSNDLEDKEIKETQATKESKKK